jgi:ribosome biogenesis GTPase
VTFPSLVPYGWNDRWAALLAGVAGPRGAAGAEGPALAPGRVVRHDGTAVTLALPDGVRPITLSRRLEPAPTVGDWVAVDGEVPVAVLERTSLLTRRSAHTDTPQSLAANVDAVLVVCGLDRPVKPGRLDRVITLAWDAGATPAVVLAKADLAGDPTSVARAVADDHPGVEVVTTSVVAGTGMDDLHALVRDRTVVLVGESGAGKSSLTNALVGDQVMATAEVRAGDAKGRHTTTTREAHLVPGGGVLIDTPGLRAVGLWADRDAVAATFADVDGLRGARRAGRRHAGSPAVGRLAGARARGGVGRAAGHPPLAARPRPPVLAGGEGRAAAQAPRRRGRRLRLAYGGQASSRRRNDSSSRPRSATSTSAACTSAAVASARRSTVMRPRNSTSQPANPAVSRPAPWQRRVISATSGTSTSSGPYG